MQRWLTFAACSGLMAAAMTGQLSWSAQPEPRGSVCMPGSQLGDGRLGVFDVHYLVLVDRADLPTATRRNMIPTASSQHHSPLTGRWVGSEQWFVDETELINRSFVTEAGTRICQGRDCLRFRHASHTFFEDIEPEACPELYGLVHPDTPEETESQPGFVKRLREVVAACEDPRLLRPHAINVVIFDTAGWEEPTQTVDRRRTTSFAARHAIRPTVFIDYTRLFRADRARAKAAEEHEIGHLLGLGHVCDPAATATTANNPMQGNCGVRGGRNRTGGFSRAAHDRDTESRVDQVETMIRKARRIQRRWLGC